MQHRGGIYIKCQLKDKEEKLGRQQNVEKALFIEITVNNFLELECMKPKIQEAQRLLSQSTCKGFSRICFKEEEENNSKSLRYQKKKKKRYRNWYTLKEK